MRYEQYKIVYLKQSAEGLAVWREPLVELRAPELYSLRSDPFERSIHESGNYDKWYQNHVFIVLPAIAVCSKYLESFKEFPPRQSHWSFNISSALDKMQKTQTKF